MSIAKSSGNARRGKIYHRHRGKKRKTVSRKDAKGAKEGIEAAWLWGERPFALTFARAAGWV